MVSWRVEGERVEEALGPAAGRRGLSSACRVKMWAFSSHPDPHSAWAPLPACPLLTQEPIPRRATSHPEDRDGTSIRTWTELLSALCPLGLALKM